MAKITIEDIVISITIVIIVGIAIWKLIGSPSDVASLISITLFIATLGLGLWKKIYLVEKKTEVGFMKVKGELNLIKNNLNYIRKDLDSINNKLLNIENLVKKKR